MIARPREKDTPGPSRGTSIGGEEGLAGAPHRVPAEPFDHKKASLVVEGTGVHARGGYARRYDRA